MTVNQPSTTEAVFLNAKFNRIAAFVLHGILFPCLLLQVCF
jgi:hypothetical protein